MNTNSKSPSFRCVACNNVLTKLDRDKRKSNGDYEDMCGYCRGIAFSAPEIILSNDVVDQESYSIETD